MNKLRLFWRLIKGNIFKLLLIMIFLGAVPFTYVKYLVPQISTGLISIQRGLGLPIIMNSCIRIFVGYGVLQFLHFIGIRLLSYTLSKIYNTTHEKAFNIAQNMPFVNIVKKNDGEIERSISLLAESLCNSIEMFVFYIFHSLLSACFIVHSVFRISNKWIGLFVLFWVVFVITSIIIISHPIRKNNADLVHVRNKQSGFITDVFKNIVLTKLFRTQNIHAATFHNLQIDDAKYYTKSNNSIANSKFIIATINVTFLCCYWFFLGKYRSIIHNINIVTLFQLGSKVTESLWILLCNGLPCFYTFGKLLGVIDFLAEPQEDLSGSIVPINLDNIEVKNLSYNYNQSRTLFNGLSISMNKEFVCLQGASGTGKSVLIKMISGLIRPADNTVFIDNHDINQINKKLLLRRISFLPQNDLIFNNTIMYNLRLGNAHATDEEIKETCKLTGVYDFVERFDEKYEKICGNNGSNLSGGEIKRISFTRMLLYDQPGNLIILDEPFNNLDKKTVQILLDYLSSIKGQRLILCVDHSPHAEKIADKIIKVDALL